MEPKEKEREREREGEGQFPASDLPALKYKLSFFFIRAARKRTRSADQVHPQWQCDWDLGV